MSLKRDRPIPPPPAGGEWEIICGTREARTGWPDLQRQAGNNLARAHHALRTNPMPVPETDRQHALRRKQFRTGQYQGRTLPQWQYEITGGGRIWYLVDAEQRKVIVMLAQTGHPKATE